MDQRHSIDPMRVIRVENNPRNQRREHETAYTIRYLKADRRVCLDHFDEHPGGPFIITKEGRIYLDEHTCKRLNDVMAGWEDPGKPVDEPEIEDEEPDDEPPAPAIPAEVRVRILPGERAQLRDETGALVTFTPDPGKRRLPSMEELIRRVFGAHLDPDPRMRPIYKVRETATGAIFRLRSGVECQAAYWAGTP